MKSGGVGISLHRRFHFGAQLADGNSGQGLALHTTMMAVIGGTLAVESAPGAYTRVTLTLPRESL